MGNRPLETYSGWTGYADLGVPLEDASPELARSVFEHFLADRSQRVEVLRAFFAKTRGSQLTLDEAGVATVERWLWPWLESIVRDRAVTDQERSALLHDIGVFAGEALIREQPQIEWQLLARGPRSLLGYHFAVLGPFTKGLEPHWPVTIEMVTDGYLLRSSLEDRTISRPRPRLLFRYRLFSGRIDPASLYR
jgi:hypothetical protein